MPRLSRCLLVGGLIVIGGAVGGLSLRQSMAASDAGARRAHRLAVPADVNAATRSVAEALAGGRNPERLSAAFVPERFDEAKYRENKRAYLDTVEPGRIWQPAEASEETPAIEVLDGFRGVDTGGRTTLSVKAVPGAPVTFTSLDLGVFQNGLNSVTVEADKEGVARVTLTAIEGTMGYVEVLASSPMTSGIAELLVFVGD